MMNGEQSIPTVLISDSELASARTHAAKSGRQVIKELAKLTGHDQLTILQALADKLNIKILKTHDMERFQPALEIVSLASALERRAVLLKADGSYLAVVSDAFGLLPVSLTPPSAYIG